MSSFWLYFELGYHHVLDIQAYDHVLFLIVLSVAYTFNEWKRVFWLVTVFTIGHSLSLMLSVYDVVKVKADLVEFLIPITILVTAGFNVFTAGNSKQKGKLGLLFFMTLFFGTIHGLGFSNYFKQIAAISDTKFLPLLEFALGIETAQLIIVLVVLILSFIFQTVFRFSKRDWVMVISAIVIGRVLPMLGL